jgi:hypothetical protein
MPSIVATMADGNMSLQQSKKVFDFSVVANGDVRLASTSAFAVLNVETRGLSANSPAYDEVVIDHEAWTETVVDTAAHCSVVHSPAYTQSQCVWPMTWIPAVTHEVNHAAITHIVHHVASSFATAPFEVKYNGDVVASGSFVNGSQITALTLNKDIDLSDGESAEFVVYVDTRNFSGSGLNYIDVLIDNVGGELQWVGKDKDGDWVVPFVSVKDTISGLATDVVENSSNF